MSSLYQRADGKWCVAVTTNGKRHVYYTETERQAKAKLSQLDRAIGAVGALPAPGRRTVEDLLNEWLATSELRPKTVYGYRQTLQVVLPAIGSLPISRLEPAHLQRLFTDLAKSSKRRAQGAYSVLHRALRMAVLWQWLPNNPADRVQKPSYRPERKEVWSIEDLHCFLEGTAGDWLHPLWVVAVQTGARLGELAALRPEDVDLSAGRMTIRRTGQFIAGKWTEGNPKTRAGTRTIVLPAAALAAFREQRRLVAERRLAVGPAWEEDLGLVFPSYHGGPLRQSVAQNAMQSACKRLGLPPRTPHSLRHLSASLLLDAGISVPAVSARLGHANPSITLAVYGHRIGDADRKAAEVLARAFGG